MSHEYIIGKKNCCRSEAASGKSPILHVGYAIPEQLMNSWTAVDMHPQVQSHQHQWALIRGIELAAGRSIDLVSVAAIGDWPRNPLWYVPGKRWSHASGARDVMVFFINLLFIKQITRYVGVFCHLLHWLLSHRKSSDRVVFHYGTQSSQLWALLLSSIFVPATKIVIMADPPSVDLQGEGWVRRLARRFDRWLQMVGLRNVEGMVVLAEALAKDFAPGVPFCVSEGVAPDLPMTLRKPGKTPFVAMYAGALLPDYGVRLILDCVALLPSGIEIWLFGRGLLLHEALEMAKKQSSLRVFGFRSRGEILQKTAEAAIMLNPRSTSAWFVHYSFPSKVLECMASGTPLLSTRLPTIPADYDPYVFWLNDESPGGLARRLVELRELGVEALHERGLQAREFVRNEKSETAQGKRIWSFASRLAGKTRVQKV